MQNRLTPRRWLAACLTVCLLLPLAFAQLVAPSQESGFVGELSIGGSATGRLQGLSDDDLFAYHTYVVNVPAGTAQLVIRIQSAQDMDLAVKFGSEFDFFDDADYLDFEIEEVSEIVIPNPMPGPWYIDVVNAYYENVVGEYLLTIR